MCELCEIPGTRPLVWEFLLEPSISRDHRMDAFPDVVTAVWTEPVKHWPKACRRAFLSHTVLLQIIARSLPSIIVIGDDPRWKTSGEVYHILK